MTRAGLETSVDAAGNTFGRLGPAGPAVVTGSHIDTVPRGGPLDGALGVLAGLECLHTLRERRVATRLPLMVAAWSDEEGRYAGLFGSRAFIGGLDRAAIPDLPFARRRSARGRHEAGGLRRAQGPAGQGAPRRGRGVRRAAHRAGAAPRGRGHPHRRRDRHRRQPAQPPHLPRPGRPRGHHADGVAEGRVPGRRRVRARGRASSWSSGAAGQRDQLRPRSSSRRACRTSCPRAPCCSTRCATSTRGSWRGSTASAGPSRGPWRAAAACAWPSSGSRAGGARRVLAARHGGRRGGVRGVSACRSRRMPSGAGHDAQNLAARHRLRHALHPLARRPEPPPRREERLEGHRAGRQRAAPHAAAPRG